MRKWSEIIPADKLEIAKALANRAQNARVDGAVIYPPQSQIFQALTLTPPEMVRVVIVGQDPYHEEGQANGLAFSVNPGVPIPPSLKNIFKELRDDLGIPIPQNGDLTPWAKQGVLLLNTVLTVQQGAANSHKDWGWQEFVLSVFRACTQLPQPVVFLLWGRQAQSFTAGLEFSCAANKKWLGSSHPSPLGAGKRSGIYPPFLGSKPFSQANRWLREMGAEPVDWGI